jgi:hypothetical protein
MRCPVQDLNAEEAADDTTRINRTKEGGAAVRQYEYDR